MKGTGREESCECECPPTTRGTFCEQLIHEDYYEARDPFTCGGNVTQETYIETPGFPERLRPFLSCAWVIKAPPGMNIRLTFDEFSFQQRHKESGSVTNNKCLEESVEIRLHDAYQGQFFCGNELRYRTFESSRSEIVVLVSAGDKNTGYGLRAFIEHISRTTASQKALESSIGGIAFDKLLPFAVLNNVLKLLGQTLRG